MDIIKVIVRGELPEGCSDCSLLKTNEQYCYQYCAFYFIPESKDITDDSKRPTWCPLVAVSDLAVSDDGYGWIVEDPDTPWKD